MSRKLIKRAAWLLGFVLLFLLIIYRVNDALRLKARAGDVVHDFFSLPKDTIDVLYAGTSKVYRSISPMEIWEQNGITGYVLGTPSQTIPVSYYLIKEAIRRQHPKVVMLGVFAAHYTSYDYSSQRLHQATDDIPWGKTRWEMYTELLPKVTGSLDEMAEYVFPFIKFHARWSELEKSDFEANYSFLKGFAPDYHVNPTQAPAMPEETGELFSGTEEYFEKIAALCRDEGVSLILLRAPSNDYDEYDYDTRMGNALIKMAEDMQIPVLDFERERDLAGIDYKTDILDDKHINTYGAVKVSRYVGNYLADNYALAGHKAEAAYASWDEEYDLYLEECRYRQSHISNKDQDE